MSGHWFRQLLAALLAIAFAGTAFGGEPECWLPCYAAPTDGDSLVGEIVLPWGITLRDQRIRAADYDAWEASRVRRTVEITEDELRKGRLATEALSDLLDSGRLYVSPVRPERDAYGRVLAKWMVVRDGERIDVAEYMQRNGHCRPMEAPRP